MSYSKLLVRLKKGTSSLKRVERNCLPTNARGATWTAISFSFLKRGESGRESQHGGFLFYRAGRAAKDRRVDRRGEAKFLSHQNGVSSLGFLVVEDSTIDILTLDFICLELQTIGCSIKDDKAVQIVSKPRM